MNELLGRPFQFNTLTRTHKYNSIHTHTRIEFFIYSRCFTGTQIHYRFCSMKQLFLIENNWWQPIVLPVYEYYQFRRAFDNYKIKSVKMLTALNCFRCMWTLFPSVKCLWWTAFCTEYLPQTVNAKSEIGFVMTWAGWPTYKTRDNLRIGLARICQNGNRWCVVVGFYLFTLYMNKLMEPFFFYLHWSDDAEA